MSRLIEALKKAEEAKRKAQEADAEPTLDLSNQEESSGGLTLEPAEPKESSPTSEASPDSIQTSNFELEPTFAPETAAPEVTPKSDSDTASSETSAPAAADKEPAIAPETGSEGAEPPPAGAIQNEEPFPPKRRLTDEDLEEPDQALVTQGQKKRLSGILFLAALILLAGGTYVYFTLSDSNNYSSASQNPQTRGFLGSEIQPNPNFISQRADAEEESSSENFEGVIGGVENTQLEPASPDSGVNLQTINAVNELLASTEASVEIPVIADSQTTFKITRQTQVEGISSSLAYAEDNFQGGETEAAKLEYIQLLEKQPNNLNALEGLARLLAKAGNPDEASELFARMLQLDPRNPTALAGMTQATNGDDPIVYEARLKSLAEQYPQEAFIKQMLGNHLASQQRWNEAQGNYDQAIKAMQAKEQAIPAEYYFNHAVSLDHLGFQDRALLNYQAALALYSKSGQPLALSVINRRISELKEK